LHRWNTLGAWPSQLKPYSVLDAMKTQAEALLMADVQTTTLMIDGRMETPERVKAITNGDCCAVPVETLRAGSLDGLG
jgi:hypothetical protein